jgi:hypothetical protein
VQFATFFAAWAFATDLSPLLSLSLSPGCLFSAQSTLLSVKKKAKRSKKTKHQVEVVVTKPPQKREFWPDLHKKKTKYHNL